MLPLLKILSFILIQSTGEDSLDTARVIAELEAGKIPIEITEELKLINPESKEALEFSKQMNQLLEPVFPDLNLKQNPLRFVVVEDAKINGLIIKSAKPPLIAISTGALQKLKNLNQILTLVGHEIGHLVVDQRYGPQSNSKGEEYTADIYPLKFLDSAGYDIKESIEFFKILNLQDPIDPRVQSSRFGELMDVHGLSENRLKAVTLAVASIDHSRGGLKGTLHPTPQFLESAGSRKHQSYLRSRIDFEGFEDLDADSQIKILKAHIHALKPQFRNRTYEYRQLIRKLNIDPQNLEQVAKATQLADSLLESEQGRKVYSDLTTHMTPSGEPEAVGALLPLKNAVRKFVKAENAKDIQESATAVQKFLKENPQFDEALLSELKWPNFKLPSPQKIRRQSPDEIIVSWNLHHETAERTRSADIFATLYLLGIHEARAVIEWPASLMDSYANSNLMSVSSGPTHSDYNFDQLKINEDGEIKRVNTSGSLDEFETALKLRLKARHGQSQRSESSDHLEQQSDRHYSPLRLSETEAWHGLEDLPKNYKEFLKRNRQNLADVINFGTDSRQIGPFLKRLAQLANSGDPESMDLVRLFFRDSLKGIADHKLDYKHPLRVLFSTHRSLFSPEEYTTILLQRFLWTELYVFKQFIEQTMSARAVGGRTPSVLKYLTEGKTKIMLKQIEERLKITRGLLNYNQANSFDDLNSIYKSLKSKGLDSDVVMQIMTIELLDLSLRKPPKNERIERLEFLHALQQWGEVFGGDQYSLDFLKDVLVDRYITSRQSWPNDLEGLQSVYHLLGTRELFPPGSDLKYELLSKIEVAIRKESNPLQKLKSLEALVHGPRIQDPHVRARIFETYMDQVLKVEGLDQGDKAYHERIIARVRKLKETLIPIDFYEIIWGIADRIEAQRELSLAIQKVQFDIKKEDFHKSQILGVGGEWILEMTQKYPEFGDHFIEFLSSAATPQSAKKVSKSMSELTGDHEATRIYPNEMLLIHRNFWTTPLFVRVGIMDSLLFPPKQMHDQKAFYKTFQKVLQKVFPPTDEYAFEARRFVEDYVEILPDYQKSLLITALLVAAQKQSDSTSKLSMGEKLAIVLEIMGPAEIKAGQAGSSHPGIKDIIRQGLSRLKGRAAPPNRGELFDIFYETVPQSIRQGHRVKQLLGSASYYIVFETQNSDGDSEVFAVLRPYAIERAKQGFERMLALAKKRGPDDPIYNVLTQLIEQGKYMSAIETDAELNQKQTEIAQRLYQGMKAQVGDTVFEFSIAQVLESGKGWKRMKKAEGVHFDDLPEKTAKQLAYKADVAKAYLALEFHMLLSGMEFDHDRHGAQLKVLGNKITLYDFGAMSLDPPSADDRKIMVDVMSDMIEAHFAGKDLHLELFKKTSELHQQTGQIPRHLSALQKGLLALQNFARYVPKDEFVNVIKAAFEQGIHPEIQAGLMTKVLEKPELGALLAASVFGSTCKGPLIKLSKRQP